MRHDAAKNRERILEVARERIGERGEDVAMDDLAAAAGVAVGTLYRHFANKRALIDAVLLDAVEQIAATAEAALARTRSGAPAVDELASVFRYVAERHGIDAMVKRAAAALGGGAASHPEALTYADGSPERRAWDAIAALLRTAQRDRQVREDLEVDDLVALLGGVPGVDAPAKIRATYVDVVLAGIRA